FLKVWHPKTSLENRDGPASPPAAGAGGGALVDTTRRHSTAAVLKGWSPFLLASVFIFVWGMPRISPYLTSNRLKQPMTILQRAVVRVPPVDPEPTLEDAIADLNFLSLPGTAVFLGAVL